jgi:hypothetical protein
MAKIVGVHGIAQQYLGAYTLTDRWLPALRDGVATVDRALAASLSADDLRVSYYGDLFRPRGALAVEDDFSPEDLKSDEELELLHVLYNEALDGQPDENAPPGALGPVGDMVTRLGRTAAVQRMLERLLASRAFGGNIPEAAFIGNLKQVVRFLNDPGVRSSVLSRVKDEVGDDTLIVIGHSLGSVVAYEFLAQFQPANVTTFITLGSPLGIRNVVFDRLTPKPLNNNGTWPARLSRWANVADGRDIVAMQKSLAPLFPPAPGNEGIVDELVNNGDEPHGIGPYLTSQPVGTVIAAALGR